MSNIELKKSLGKIAILNDLLEKELTTLNPQQRINDINSMVLLDRLKQQSKKVSKLFDTAFGDNAEHMGEVYDEIDNIINKQIQYD